MKITKIETLRFNPNAGGSGTEHGAWYTQYRSGVIWVQIYTDEGLVGLGESNAGASATESAIHDFFAPLLIDRDPAAIDRHWYNMFRMSDHIGFGGAETRAISAIDIALWDLLGQALNVPIYQLLGGASRDRIPVYDTGGGVSYPDGAVEYAEELLDRGILAMKLDGYPADHPGDGYMLSSAEMKGFVEPIRGVAEAVGDRMQIAVDGHGFWSLPAAIRIARALEDLPIMWFEEMLSPRNVDAHLRFSDQMSVPVCGSERLVSRYAYREYIERGAFDIVMPDLGWTGGISEAHRLSSFAEMYQLPVSPHDCTGPVSLFASAHICMNAPNAMIMETNRTFYEGWYQGLLTNDLRIDGGHLLAPVGPGLGTQLSPEVLQRQDIVHRVTDVAAKHPFGWRQ